MLPSKRPERWGDLSKETQQGKYRAGLKAWPPNSPDGLLPTSSFLYQERRKGRSENIILY